MATETERLTVDDYYAMTVEGDRKQLVDGRIVVNEPLRPHAVLQKRLLVALHAWTTGRRGRGEVSLPQDVRLDEHNLFGPDLIWLREEHVPPPGAKRAEHLPDLCVEIRSRSTWRYDIGAKRDAYERAGLPELWLVDDRQPRIFVHRRSRPGSATFDVALELAAGDTLGSPQLAGFELALDELYRDL